LLFGCPGLFRSLALAALLFLGRDGPVALSGGHHRLPRRPGYTTNQYYEYDSGRRD
ncbi:MAG: hypothetical protein IH892_06120, partial [Planctomycetes bacterium]|nr:hypothetical protein [Planctomycetota bacterium]